jgi:L-aspartate oxidase
MSELHISTDFLIIGSGLSGLFLAKKLSDLKAGSILVITKKQRIESNSANAQGGIAVVMSDKDSFEKHVQDTLVAGDGLCDEQVVRAVVENAPRCVGELIDIGIPFTRKADGFFDLSKEAGHSQRRILHAGDFTGNEIMIGLLDTIDEIPGIRILEDTIAINLVMDDGRCIGVHALDSVSGTVLSIEARYTVLATGGAGKVYTYTSNPDVATGDGVAMAYRVGARIANMECYQFHPTCLYHPYAKSFLISEALRGEGAVLLNRKEGERFMHKYHEKAELAPRDIVSRAIDAEMKVHGIDCVYLDISFKDPDFLISRFPNIYQRCLSFGIDITKQPIPVVPAAHFSCGGVQAGLDGQTSVPGLLAIGETACTGLHGANRLASNSLLECLITADFTAKYLAQEMETSPLPVQHVREWETGTATESQEAVVVQHDWHEARATMWDYVGIVRSMKNLTRAKARMDFLFDEIKNYYWEYLITPDLVELRHIVLVAEVIIKSAMMRKESRGAHYILDYPGKLPVAENTIVTDDSA